LTLTFELERDFCRLHLTAKFRRSTFNRWKAIVLTDKLKNKQTPLKTSTSLRYATPVGKIWLCMVMTLPVHVQKTYI